MRVATVLGSETGLQLIDNARREECEGLRRECLNGVLDDVDDDRKRRSEDVAEAVVCTLLAFRGRRWACRGPGRGEKFDELGREVRQERAGGRERAQDAERREQQRARVQRAPDREAEFGLERVG